MLQSHEELAWPVVHKLAAASRAGRLESVLAQLATARGIDDETKASLAELGRDEGLLRAVEDYLRPQTGGADGRYTSSLARGD
jgi:hypothetical protein